MASENLHVIIGNLGGDPDVRFTPQGRAVATLTVATNRRWTTEDPKTKEVTKHEEVSWHRVIVWGKQAEQCGQYLSKGDPVYIRGRVHTRKYSDKDGNDRWATETIAATVQFLKPAPSNRPPHPADDGESRSTTKTTSTSRASGPGPSSGGDGPEPWDPGYIPSDPGDDDIPF